MFDTLEAIRNIPAESIYVDPILSDEETKSLEGKFLLDRHVKTVFDRNVDVFCKKTGKPLFKLRKHIIATDVSIAAYNALHKAGEMASDNRGSAAGPLTDEEIMAIVKSEGGKGFVRVDERRYKMVKKDGSVSGVTRAKRTNGGIVGYFGKTARIPYCRLTAYTQENFQQFQNAFPIVQRVDRVYEALMPESYAKQKEAVRKSSQDFVIPDSAYSTITVNKNFRTALHYDAGDFEAGFGNLVVIRKGKFRGCYTSFPQYGAGVDAHTGDVLLMDVHQLHGNTPRVDLTPNSVRLALVMYFRDDVQKCGSASEELDSARKSRDIAQTA